MRKAHHLGGEIVATRGHEVRLSRVGRNHDVVARECRLGVARTALIEDHQIAIDSQRRERAPKRNDVIERGATGATVQVKERSGAGARDGPP